MKDGNARSPAGRTNSAIIELPSPSTSTTTSTVYSMSKTQKDDQNSTRLLFQLFFNNNAHLLVMLRQLFREHVEKELGVLCYGNCEMARGDETARKDGTLKTPIVPVNSCECETAQRVFEALMDTQTCHRPTPIWPDVEGNSSGKHSKRSP